jgi:hypothetical protein
MRAKAQPDIIVAIIISVEAVAIRIIDINQPFIDERSCRQSDVASIARNYLRNGFDFAQPQIDWAGGEAGYVGTEFPILPFTAAICYKFLGAHEWIGRLQSLIFFAVSLPFFFLLVREVFGAAAAGWALFFYSFAPLNIMASRCFMPDAPSLSLAIIGLNLFFRWTGKGRSAWLFLAAIAISLALLIKLSSAVIAAPIAYLAVAVVCDRRPFLSKNKTCGGLIPPLQLLLLFATIALLPSALWYWHGYEIAQKFYPHHFFGAGGIRIESLAWYWKIAQRTIASGLTPGLFLLTILGIGIASSMRTARIFYWWLLAMVVFVIAVGYGNRHPWYQLPFVPIAAAFAGLTCEYFGSRLGARFSSRCVFIFVIGASFALLSFIYTKSFYAESAADLRSLGLELLRLTPEKSLVIAADYGDPTVFYYAERRGWHFMEDEGIYNGHPESSAAAIADLETLRRRGATHFVVYTGSLWWLDYFKEFAQHLDKTASLIETNPKFEIFSLSPRNENK